MRKKSHISLFILLGIVSCLTWTSYGQNTDLQRCKNGVYAYLTETLLQLQSMARASQRVEFEYHGNAYTLVNNTLQTANLPDDDLNAGNWTDASTDSRMRYHINGNEIIQLKAFGFRSNLPLASGKQADLKGLSAHILAQSNRYLLENNATGIGQDAPEVSTETFADGERIEIKGKILKVISEGVGVTTTLLKTGEMEEGTYLSSEKGKSVIHAPGLVTGSFEVVAQKVTDVTSLTSLVYDVAVDAKVRDELKAQLKTIKDEIANDAGSFLPILGQVLVTVGSGNTPDEWNSVWSAYSIQ